MCRQEQVRILMTMDQIVLLEISMFKLQINKVNGIEPVAKKKWAHPFKFSRSIVLDSC